MKRTGLALTLMAGGFAAIGRVMAAVLQSAPGDTTETATSTGRSRKRGVTVASARREAGKRRNVLRARGHHRKAVR